MQGEQAAQNGKDMRKRQTEQKEQPVQSGEAAAGGPQQQRYEVRLDRGEAGEAAIAPGAGVVVRVSALGPAARAVADAEAERSAPGAHADPARGDSAHGDSAHGDPARADSAEGASELDARERPVLAASLRNRSAVARWILQRQIDAGERQRVAVVIDEGTARIAADDLLAAGAVVDALAEVGIDYSSPEAATAAAAFTGLKRAVGHLLSASVAGQRLVAEGRREEVVAAGKVDACEVVPRLD